MSSPRTYHIETMGCQMNERDSETIAGLLEGLGLRPVSELSEADVIVLNTCAVREKPVHKVFSRLGDVRKLKHQRPQVLVVVAGCVAQVAADDIRARAPFVDVVIGPRNLAALTEAVQRARAGPQCIVDNTETVPEGLRAHRAPGVGAFVNVSYGCNNFCTYCVVPYARGPEQSRDPHAVVSEVQEAVAQGYREVTLLGQNVNSYCYGNVRFPELLQLVDSVPGLWRLRFTTSHPKDLSPKLLRAIGALPRVCEHLHLPIQAGDDEVLARMGRGYTADHFRALVAAAREAVPGIAITTDVMVGFPGETEEQFRRTLQAFETLRFDQAFMFKYSDRPGTRAAQFTPKVAEQEKQDRLLRLAALQNRIAREINQARLGKPVEVLVEGPDLKTPARWRGHTRTNKLVIFDAPGHTGPLVGKLVTVHTERAYLWGFTGTLRSVSDED